MALTFSSRPLAVLAPNSMKGLKMKKLLLVSATFCLIASFALASSLKIAALVNGEIISSEDLQNRINAFMMNTKIPFNSQTKSMITQRVLNNAVDEKLKLQEAAKNGISISDKEVAAQMRLFEQNNGIPTGQLTKILQKAGVSEDTMQEQLKSDLAWVRLIRKKYYAEGTPTQKEINQTMAEAKADLNTPKYMVSEIFIKKSNAKNIWQLVDNLRQDDRFELYAMQFSDSPSAANGGNLGWVNTGKLASVLESKLKNMDIGDISDPIMLGDGYYILKLQRRFNPKTDKVEAPTQEQIRTLLENQKMESLSKKLLQDLRQKAVIEIRS